MLKMDDTNKTAFRQFLDVLRDITGNDTEVINLIERRYAKANPSYTSSSQFLQLVRKVQKRVQQDAENKYIFVKELSDELKAYDLKHLKKRKRKNLIAESDSESSDTGSVGPVDCNVGSTTVSSQKTMDSEKDKDTNADEKSAPQQKRIKLSPLGCVQNNSDSVQGTELIPCSPEDKIVFVDFRKSVDAEMPGTNDVIEVLSSIDKDGDQESVKEGGNTDVEDIMDDDDSDFETKGKNCQPPSKTEGLGAAMEGTIVSTKNAKKIKKYQLFLERLDERIKKLEEKEVSLDDLENGSNYLIIDKLKKTFVKHWSRLCELQARNPTTGRPIDKKFKCTATRYPEINKRIQKFVNKKKIFPDYHDVRSIVQKCNIRYKLGLGKGMVDMVSRDAFTDVGNKLQRRRLEDYDCAFGSHLTDTVRDYDDPALYDVELRRKLENNQKQSKSNLDELIKKFAYKQETEGDNSGDDEKDNQEDDEVQREEQEILNKEEDDAGNVSDQNHDDTVTCHKQTNQAAENRKVPTAMNVKSVDNVDRVQESDCKTSNISQGVLELSDGNAIKEVNVQSKDNESSSTEDSKKNSKREEPQVAKTVSLQDILGGSTITKEDVETFHKENFPESNKHKDSKIGVERCHVNSQVMQQHVADDNDDFIEVLSSGSDEVPQENGGPRKPVNSHAAREGIKRLKQLKQPSLIQQMSRERAGVSSDDDSSHVHVAEISTSRDNEKSFVLLSSEDEERFLDDCTNLGCSLLDPRQQLLGTPFRRAQLLAGDSSLKNPESRQVGVTRATRSPRDVASTVSAVSEGSEMESEVPWVVSDVRSLSSKLLPDNKRDKSENPTKDKIASQCMIERNNAKMKQLTNRAFEPRHATARNVLPQYGDVASTSLSGKCVAETQQSKRTKETIPFAFDRSRNVVVLDDEVDDTESVLDLTTSLPSKNLVDRPSVINRKELYVIPPGITKSSSDYTYKKVHTVVKQTSVSSSSSKTPQKETVVRSSSKTIIRRTPQEYGRDELSAFHPQDSPRVVQQASGSKDLGRKSALSGFRLTRRKINKPSDMMRQSPSSMIKEVQNVTRVLGHHKGSHSQNTAAEDETIVLDDSDILENYSAARFTGADDRLAKRSRSQFEIVGNHNSSIPYQKDHLVVNTRSADWLGRERAQATIGKSTPGNLVRSMKTDPNKRSFQVMPGQQLSLTTQRHQGHLPQETTNALNMYADSVISSSEQPPELGEPDCVIILSDSD